MNQISIRTNKGEYFGGETIYGTVYLWICSPTAAKRIKLKVKGYEKCEWEYKKYVSKENEDGTTELEQVQAKVKGDKSFFKTEFELVTYNDSIPIGHYAYPFQYPLRQEIPGSFKMKGKVSNDDNEWEANVKYKVKAEMESLDGKLKVTQPLVIRTDARTQVNQSVTHDKEGTVKMCCCIPRGTVRLQARLNSSVYEAGSTAKVHVNVQNDSSVDIDNFVLKLMQVIHLRGQDEDEGDMDKRITLTNTVCESKYEGCESGNSKECDIDLQLKSKDGEIEPTTKGSHIQCGYHVDIEMQVSWAPDIEIHAPIVLTAPNNSWWHQWAPPQWLVNCQPVPVQGPCAVPQPVMSSQTFSNIPGFGPPL